MTDVRRIPNLSNATEAADHLQTMIAPDQLSQRTALVVGCGPRARPTGHWHLVGCADEATPSECAAVLAELVARLELDSPVHGILVGLTRPGGEEVQPYDRAWFRAYHRTCHQAGLTPYGVYTVTRGGARAVQIDDAA